MKPHLQTTIWTLLKANASKREIERVTGIFRHTIRAYQQRFATEQRANCPGVATGSAPTVRQIAPPRPPALAATVPVASSLCEPHREFIEAQLHLKRNAVAILQDLVDTHGFAGQCNSVSNRMKVLVHDGFGLWLAARRLNRGRFAWGAHPSSTLNSQIYRFFGLTSNEINNLAPVQRNFCSGNFIG